MIGTIFCAWNKENERMKTNKNEITKKWCGGGVNYNNDYAILFIQVKIGVDSYFYDTSMKIEVEN